MQCLSKNLDILDKICISRKRAKLWLPLDHHYFSPHMHPSFGGHAMCIRWDNPKIKLK